MGPRTSDGKKKPRVRKRAHGEPDAPVYRNRFANLASPEAGWAVPGVTGLCLSDCGWGVGGREGTRLTGAFVGGDVRRGRFAFTSSRVPSRPPTCTLVRHNERGVFRRRLGGLAARIVFRRRF